MTLSVLDIVVVVAGNIALLVLRGLDHNALSSASQSASSAADTEPVGIYLLRKFPDCFIVAIFLVCVIVPVLMLWGMHITLICRGITTNEKIKFATPHIHTSLSLSLSAAAQSSKLAPQENLCTAPRRQEPVSVVRRAVCAGPVPRHAAVGRRRALRRALHDHAGGARDAAAPTKAGARRQRAGGPRRHRCRAPQPVTFLSPHHTTPRFSLCLSVSYY